MTHVTSNTVCSSLVQLRIPRAAARATHVRLGDNRGLVAALRHGGAGQPRRSHLSEHLVEPLQRPVEVDLDPTRRTRHRLSSAMTPRTQGQTRLAGGASCEAETWESDCTCAVHDTRSTGYKLITISSTAHTTSQCVSSFWGYSCPLYHFRT